MDKELVLSIMASDAAGIQPLLDQFGAETHIRVRTQLLAWDTAWAALTGPGAAADGPDISEIGTTWMGDLIGQDLLKSFEDTEINSVKQASSFFTASWKTVSLVENVTKVYAIPWLAGARLLFYRKSLFDRAGINPINAFTNNEQVEKTIECLKSAGVRTPWTVPTGLTHTTLLHIASWVWGSNGDFLSADGKRVTFMDPPAMAGMKAYFALARYLSPEVQQLTGLGPDEHFLSHDDTAMIISGPWLFAQACERGIQSDIGIALPPGRSFVGGSNLVIWKRSTRQMEALELIRFLLRPEIQAHYAALMGLIPAKTDALGYEPFRSDLLWVLAVHASRAGKSFPTSRFWGQIEDRLTTGLRAVWADMLYNPTQNPQIPLERHLAPLADELNALIAGSETQE